MKPKAFSEIVAAIEELERSPYVMLARRAEESAVQLYAYLEQLKKLEAKGKELEKLGITDDYLDEILEGDE